MLDTTFTAHAYEAMMTEVRERAEHIKHAWNAYWGKLDDPLKVRQGKNDNVKVASSRTVVDASVGFLFGKEVAFQVKEQSNEWLDQVWQHNKKQTLLTEIGMNGAVCGHLFAKIQLPDKAAGETLPTLINLDPAIVWPQHDPHNIRKVIKYVVEYRGIGADGKPRMYRQVHQQGRPFWTIREYERGLDAGTWVETAAPLWPYPFSAIIDAQNLLIPNQFWGMSDIEDDVIALNSALNFSLSNLNRIVRFHAHPKTVGIGLRGQQVDVSVDGLIGLGPGQDLKNLEMSSDLAAAVEVYRLISEALHDVSDTPEIVSGRMQDIGQLSGVALQILYGPLMEKTGRKRTTYGDFLSEVNRRLLLIGGQGDQIVSNVWPDPLPHNPLEERQVATFDQQLGVSKATLLEKLGYDAATEEKQHNKEAQTALDQQAKAFDAGKGVLMPGQKAQEDDE